MKRQFVLVTRAFSGQQVLLNTNLISAIETECPDSDNPDGSVIFLTHGPLNSIRVEEPFRNLMLKL